MASKTSFSVGMGMSCRDRRTDTAQFQAPATTRAFSEATFDLDVVEVDLRQAAVVADDPLQGLLHVGAVGRLGGEDLEGIRFDHTCERGNRAGVKTAAPSAGGAAAAPYVLLMPSVLAIVPVVPRAS